MLNYEELDALAKSITSITRWRAPFDGRGNGRLQQLHPVIVDPKYDQPSVERSEVGVSLYVTASVGMGWRGTWVLDFDPDKMPETEADFWAWLNSHIFIRLDLPETTVPPPSDPASAMLYLPTALRARWTTARCPYL